MKGKILVTGGSGYFGSLLALRLRDRSESVQIFDLVDADDRPSNVEFVKGDICDFAAIDGACDGVSCVYHNVAQVPLAKDKALFESVNVDGTRNMLTAARKRGVAKVVYTSSSAIFGVPKHNPVDENTVPEPREAYGSAKLEGEVLCNAAAKDGLDVSIIRPRTILGHGRLGIFQILFEWIRGGFNVPVLGSGANVYQFIHATDLAEACILAANQSGPHTYNIGTDRYGSMRESLEGLCKHAGTGSKVTSLPRRPAEVAMSISSKLGLSPLGPYHALMYGESLYFDTSRAQSELGWRPRYSNAQMLAESYDWYCSNRQKAMSVHGPSHHRSAVKQGVLAVAKWAF